MEVMRTLLRVTVALGASAALLGCAGLEGARLYRSGSAALERGDTDRAVADLERAAQLQPQASEVQNHLGLAYAEAGRAEDARRAFERSVELDCDNQAAQHNLAVAESREGAP